MITKYQSAMVAIGITGVHQERDPRQAHEEYRPRRSDESGHHDEEARHEMRQPGGDDADDHRPGVASTRSGHGGSLGFFARRGSGPETGHGPGRGPDGGRDALGEGYVGAPPREQARGERVPCACGVHDSRRGSRNVAG